MSDETVRVPAALWWRLRDAIRRQDAEGGNWNQMGRAARALVDAAERPDEACEMCAVAHPANDCAEVDCWHNCDADRRAPAAPVGDADPDEMCPNCVTPWKCNGPHVPWPPAPLSSPRRTRDEGTDPRDDQTIRAAWDEWSRNVPESFWDVAVLPRRKPGGIEPSILWPVLLDVANRFEIWAHGFRAARLAGEDER